MIGKECLVRTSDGIIEQDDLPEHGLTIESCIVRLKARKGQMGGCTFDENASQMMVKLGVCE